MNVLQQIFAAIGRAFQFWLNDINQRRSCTAKGCSVSVGLFVIIIACSIPLTIINTAGQAVGILPTATLKPSSTNQPSSTPNSIPHPTITATLTAISSPIPSVEPSPIPLTEYLLSEDASEFFDVIPRENVAGVGDSVLLMLDDAKIIITLQAVTDVKLTTLPRERRFTTIFLVKNESDRQVVFNPSVLLQGANDSGYRLSRGGAVHIIDSSTQVIEPHSEESINVSWSSRAYNTTSGGASDQVIWIAINTEISENLFVNISRDDKVFAFKFAEVPRS